MSKASSLVTTSGVTSKSVSSLTTVSVTTSGVTSKSVSSPSSILVSFSSLTTDSADSILFFLAVSSVA